MEGTFKEEHWGTLLSCIHDGKCTPFLGAGASGAWLPLDPSEPAGVPPKRFVAAEIAQRWAKFCGYPLEDSHDLAKVSQYMAIMCGPEKDPKKMMAELTRAATPPNVTQDDELHAVLASLPLPLYVTTNYEDYMEQALRHRKRTPRPELCRWSEDLENRVSVFDDGYSPTTKSPLVFHLHGCARPRGSMVLTEDDYLDFLIRMSHPSKTEPLPPIIQEALNSNLLLFLGYSLADVNFRVLLRAMKNWKLSDTHISVQRVPSNPRLTQEQKTKSMLYSETSLGRQGILVHWNRCEDFARELKNRWENHNAGK